MGVVAGVLASATLKSLHVCAGGRTHTHAHAHAAFPRPAHAHAHAHAAFSRPSTQNKAPHSTGMVRALVELRMEVCMMDQFELSIELTDEQWPLSTESTEPGARWLLFVLRELRDG